MLSAYLLVSHGSSDPRHKAGLLRLANMMRQQLDRSRREDSQTPLMTKQQASAPFNYDRTHLTHPALAESSDSRSAQSIRPPYRVALPPIPVVGTATLEVTHIPLARQIEVFARRVMAQGVRRVVIVPLFLLAGVHVQEDLPREIATAQSLLPSRVQLLCTPYLGSYSGFKDFVGARLAATTTDRCLLLSHGSRRPAGNRGVQQLGTTVDADVAFWAVPPDLETKIVELMQQGYQHIAIAPYFLFPGGITDAITRRTEDLAERLPKLSLRLLTPLGTSTNLGKVVAELALNGVLSAPVQSGGRDLWQIAESGVTA